MAAPVAAVATNWNGPAATGPRPFIQCDDRRLHVPGYVNPCSSLTNPLPGTVPQPPAFYQHEQCVPPHVGVHSVCRYCRDHMIAKRQFLRIAMGRIQNNPPQNEFNNPGWHGFLTRMCFNCEQAELVLVAARQGVFAWVLPAHPPVATQHTMQNYPLNTCVCRHDVVGQPRCWNDQQPHWNTQRPLMRQTRDANKAWLTNCHFNHAVAVAPVGLYSASNLRIAGRCNSQRWRACRCGDDPVATVAGAQVLMCMVCEGTVLRVAPLAAPPPGGIIPRWLLNRTNTPGNFALRRPRFAMAL